MIASAIFLVVSVGLATAHSGKQSYLYVSLYDDGVEGRVEIPAADLSSALGFDIPGDVDGAERAIDEESERIGQYITTNTSLGDDAGRWPLDVAEDGRILDTENGLYVVFDLDVDAELAGAPDTFVADFSVIIESNPERDALLIIENDWRSATFANEGDHILGFSVGMTEQVVVIESAPTLDAVGEVRGIGTDAVRTGTDLMLIVAALTLLAVTARGPATQLLPLGHLARRGARTLVAFVGGLTATLWLIGLGPVSVDDRVAGIAVAVTLGATAAVAVLSRFRYVSDRALLATAGVVGLVHGFGLGTVFVGLGLDRRRPVLGLVAYEVGVVAAVVIVIACVVGPMLLLRDTALADVFTVGLAVVFLAYASAWFGERVLSEDWPIEEVANPLRVWPRNLLFVAAAITAAALVRRIGGSHNGPAEEEILRP